MTFELKSKIEFSKDLPEDAETELKKLFEATSKTNKDVKLVSTFNGIILELQITSKETRPHHLIFKLKNQINALLGRKFKVGIKSILGKEYIINFKSEQEPKSEVDLRLPISVIVKNNRKDFKITLTNIDERFLQEGCVDRLIKRVEEKIKQQYYEGRDEFKEDVWQTKEKKMFTDIDPAEELEKRRWIVRTPAKGQFVFGREYTLLSNIFRDLMVKHIYKKLRFHEMIFPKFEPWVIPETSGHVAKAQILYFVSVPEAKDWTDVEDYYKVYKIANIDQIVRKSKCVGILSYAQCPPFWTYLKGRTLDESTLPLKIYDWSGPTYRNESGGTHGLDRVEEFHRTETLWVGTKVQETRLWKEVVDTFKHFFDKVLDIEVKLAKVAPWWMAHVGLTAEKGTEEIGTYDFDAYLPYRGDRHSEWLEIQNASSIGNTYPDEFNVKGRKEEIWSGCAGGSMERWIVTFLAQKGFDPKKWPKEVRLPFERELKKIKPLKFF